jgi:small conductance mechanosensitive channel
MRWTVHRAAVACLIAVLAFAAAPRALAQDRPAPATEPAPITEKVEVAPEARDEQIEERLRRILTATRWFEALGVRVDEGVVFLSGTADTEEHRRWAGDLARRTQDVAAVVNRLEVATPSVFDFGPAIAGLEDLGRGIVGALPFVLFALIVLGIGWLLSRLAAALARRALRRRPLAPLLREVLAKVVGIAVFVVGLYIVFRVAGLTGVALSVVGGTGLVGLILGIAFRGITENFLSSIFLSLQPPFRTGDLLEIDGHVGFVERLTNRATVLLSLEGNHIQIPNSKVYQATIRNFTSNPVQRADFTVGIGYEDAISEAQEIALGVLAEHPAVLADPEPWVLVESLGPATVNLRIYFWLDRTQHSWLKVKSSVIRLVKRAFQAAGISMPDEARELVFPEGVPVRLVKDDEARAAAELAPRRAVQPANETGEVTTGAEAGLRSEAGQLREQGRKARTPEEGEDLLAPPPPTRA